MNLGKTLVKEFEKAHGIDTLSRWMSHYIAEQITIAETAVDDIKIEAENNCFNTILKLWQHRAYYHNGLRPFKNYEPIFVLLERLNPDNDKSYYYFSNDQDVINKKDGLNKEVKKWLDIASDIDNASRVLLEFALKKATECATDEESKEWINNSIDLPHSNETEIILKIIEYNDSKKKTNRKTEKKEKMDRIISRINKLNAFNEICKLILSIYENDLKELNIDEDNFKRKYKKEKSVAKNTALVGSAK